MEEDILDLTAIIPQPKAFKLGNKNFELLYNYKAIKKLEEIYGSVGAALDAFSNQDDVYTDTINFLYAGLGETYKLTKQEIESWIGLTSINLFRDIIMDALINSYGKNNAVGAEETEAGE